MEPVFGEAYKRPFRNIIDILAIIATVMGNCYVDWFGVIQIGGGLNHLFDVPNNNFTKILVLFYFDGSHIFRIFINWLKSRCKMVK